MKKKMHTPEQIVAKLRKVEALTAEGATVAEAAKQIGVSDQTPPTTGGWATAGSSSTARWTATSWGASKTSKRRMLA